MVVHQTPLSAIWLHETRVRRGRACLGTELAQWVWLTLVHKVGVVAAIFRDKKKTFEHWS